jgi:hypothetical protein
MVLLPHPMMRARARSYVITLGVIRILQETDERHTVLRNQKKKYSTTSKLNTSIIIFNHNKLIIIVISNS